MRYLVEWPKSIVLLFLIPTCIFASCGVKHPTQADLQSDFDRVKKCMGVNDKIPIHLNKVESSYVMCGDVRSRGCYDSGVITLPQKGGYNVIYHEFVHAVCDRLGFGNDPDHKCEVGGENAYLRCGGGIIVE